MSILCPDSLPITVTVNGQDYKVRTQYYIILEILKFLEDPELPDQDKGAVAVDLFYQEDVPQDWNAAYQALEAFIDRASWSNGYQGKKATERVLDWEIDAQFIWASMKQAYPFWDWSEAHWWEFKAAFDSLPATSKIKEVMQIRLQKVDSKMDKKAADDLQELKKAYRLPNKTGTQSRRRAVDIEAELRARAEVKQNGV